MNISRNCSKKHGISLIELMLAMAIFIVFLTGGLGFLVMGQKSSIKQSEYFKAEIIAQEGFDVTNFIKKQSWLNLINGQKGINYINGNWQFIPNFDTVESKYRRVITIQDVYRDINDSLVLEPTGFLEESVKYINVGITWNSGGSQKSLERGSFIADWEQDVPGYFGGFLVYADYSGADDVLKYKLLTKRGTWGLEKKVPDFGVPGDRGTKRVEVYSSDTRNEYVIVSKHVGGGQYLYAQIFNGIRWGNVLQLSSSTDDSFPQSRNFDGAYLDNGDFLLVYDNYSNSPKYRIWNGVSWSSEQTVDTLDNNGFPVWIQIKNKPDTNTAVLAIRDALQKTTTYSYDGSNWINKTEHANKSSGVSLENINIVWNKNTYDNLGMIYNDKLLDNNPNIRIWNEISNSWGTAVDDENLGGRSKILDITDNPKKNEFLACIKTTNTTLNCMEATFPSDGSLPDWNASERLASNTNNNDARCFGLGYETMSGELALLVYAEGGNDMELREPKYRTYDPVTNTWSSESILPPLGPDGTYALNTVRVFSTGDTNEIMVVMGDGNNDVTTVVWDGENNRFFQTGDKAVKKHGLSGSAPSDFWYSFAWKLYEDL